MMMLLHYISLPILVFAFGVILANVETTLSWEKR